jgi:hypothetical protein
MGPILLLGVASFPFDDNNIVFRSYYSLLERNISAFIVGVVWAHRSGRT